MSKEQKEAILEDLSKLKPEDQQFVLGYCAGRAAAMVQPKQTTDQGSAEK